jgi:PleD family two-component response regulator
MYDGNNPISKDELIFKADQALYKSKNNGKNRVTVG